MKTGFGSHSRSTSLTEMSVRFINHTLIQHHNNLGYYRTLLVLNTFMKPLFVSVCRKGYK